MANIEQNRKLMKEQMESFKKPLNEASIDMSKIHELFSVIYTMRLENSTIQKRKMYGKKRFKRIR
jgi:hypothetical protein